MPGSESCPTKALSGTRTSRDRAQWSSLHPQQGEGSTCSNQRRTGHLQQVGDKPLVREGTQLDLPIKTRNKGHQGSCKAYEVG